MKRRLFEIQLRSLWDVAEHLHTVDLDALADDARAMGTNEEIELVDAMRQARAKVPRVRR